MDGAQGKYFYVGFTFSHKRVEPKAEKRLNFIKEETFKGKLFKNMKIKLINASERGFSTASLYRKTFLDLRSKLVGFVASFSCAVSVW